MLELIVIFIAVIAVGRQIMAISPAVPEALAPRAASPRLVQMAEYASRLFTEKKWIAAEKAYLAVLKLDHKNVTGYSHLGIIYSTQKNYADAIECFEIAARLRPSAGTYQNLGLAFYDNRNYIKSTAAFEKAIMFEPSAQRYVGLSKAGLKLGNRTQVTTALEKAVELDPSKRHLVLLAEAYEVAEDTTNAETIYRRINELDPDDAFFARKVGIHLPETSA